MFKNFYRPIQDYIRSSGSEALFNDIFESRFIMATAPPSGEILWKNFLQTVLINLLPKKKPQLPFFWKPLIYILNHQNDYITEQDLHDIINKTLLKYLNSFQKHRLITQLQTFQFHLKKWVTGPYHQKFLSPELNNVRFVQDTFQLNSLWEASTFLFHCGYPYFQGKHAQCAWKRFQSLSSDNTYEDWWSQLSQTDLPVVEQIRLDVLLETFFSGCQVLFFEGLECKLESCSRCPLTDKCEFSRIHYNTETAEYIISQIKAGNIRNIKSTDLICFLLEEPSHIVESGKNLIDVFTSIHSDNLSDYGNFSDRFTILAIKELGRRKLKKESSINLTSFTNSQSVYHHFENIVKDEQQESFYTLLLDNKNKVLSEKLITRGILDQSLVHPREVFASAIQARAAAIILVHNHPSGIPTPSRQDIKITRRLCDVGKVVGIQVLDHVIIGDDCHYSFIDQGIMPEIT